MKKRYFVTMLVAVMTLGHLIGSGPARAQQQDSEKEPQAQANLVPRAVKLLETQMTEEGNRRIPDVVRQEAKCIVVFPGVVKLGAVIAFKGGQGLGSCRQTETNDWGAPALFDISAASIGIQAGIQSASVILVVTNQVGVDALLKGKASLGAGIGLAAGPVGGSVDMSTQQAFLSYVRTKGLFAGLDLEGAVLSFNQEAVAEVYGSDIGVQEILFGKKELPDRLVAFHEKLQQFAP